MRPVTNHWHRDDPDQDGDVADAIVLDSAASTDPAYSGLDPSGVSVTNPDGATDACVDLRHRDSWQHQQRDDEYDQL